MRFVLAAAGLMLAAGGCAHAQPAQTSGPAAAIERFAADYARDPHLTSPVTFGVEVDGQWWTVAMTPPAAPGEAGRSDVRAGRPAQPTFYFTIEGETLAMIDDGRMNALTAMARAQQSDPTPMDIEAMDGFQPEGDFGAFVVPFSFHFWTRGQPEVVRFGSDLTRHTHGAQAAIFYYQPGFRSGFFEVRPGQHVNEAESERTNPFPTLMIITRGRMNALIGGRSFVLSEGEAVFIPAGVSHQFSNEFDAPGQGILLMFGEGA
ncbi:MAG: cupin domain-containing protein [Hyphomonadaceae bacterium]